MLLSGANPNTHTSEENNSPILCLAAKQGFSELVSLLLEFSASADTVSDTGMSALCYAAASGHTDIVRMLILRHALVGIIDYCIRFFLPIYSNVFKTVPQEDL